MSGKVQDLTGQKFGRLTVIERAGKDEWGKITWRCSCECGGERIAPGSALNMGRVRSCGCRRELHGMAGERLYQEWQDMKKRCSKPYATSYNNYGGRGITVCDEWAKSFGAFREWAIANGYRDDLTLERNDYNGNYEPENCRWATRKEQQNNRRNNRMVEYNGKTQTLAQWADEMNIPYAILKKRIIYGWSVERILTKPVKRRNPK